MKRWSSSGSWTSCLFTLSISSAQAIPTRAQKTSSPTKLPKRTKRPTKLTRKKVPATKRPTKRPQTKAPRTQRPTKRPRTKAPRTQRPTRKPRTNTPATKKPTTEAPGLAPVSLGAQQCGAELLRAGGCPQFGALHIMNRAGFSAQQCEAWCRDVAECAGFVLNKDYPRRCFLMRDGCTQGGNKLKFNYYRFNRCAPPTVSSAQKQCGPRKVREGGCPQFGALHLLSRAGLSVQQCGDLCKDTYACAGFVLSKGPAPRCFLMRDGCTQGGNHHKFAYYQYNRC